MARLDLGVPPTEILEQIAKMPDGGAGMPPNDVAALYRAAVRAAYGEDVARESLVEHLGGGWFRIRVASRRYASPHTYRKPDVVQMAVNLLRRATEGT